MIRETGDPDVFLAGWRGHEDLPDGAERGRPAGAAVGARAVRGRCWWRRWPAGCPVMAVDAHGPAEIVDDGETGWLVPPDDEDAMVAALVEAVNGDAERRRRGDRAYEEARAPLLVAGARARAGARLRRGPRGAPGGGGRAHAARG